MRKAFYIIAAVVIVALSVNITFAKEKMEKETVKVRLETSKGNIDIELYNETPGHRDNFVKNVKEGAYDGVLFHRVINNFMIQTGDPSSKNATKGQMLGASDHGSEISAEFVYPQLFHKKGAIAAARTGDNVNPEKKSSGSQFYIVTGKVYGEQELVQMEKMMQNRQKQSVFESLCNQHKSEILQLRRNRDTVKLQELQEQLIKQTEDSVKGHEYHYTAEQKQAYTTVGGTPHLDANYTVYGQVVAGIEVVDSIQGVQTDKNDRPVDDIKIIKATIIKE